MPADLHPCEEFRRIFRYRFPHLPGTRGDPELKIALQLKGKKRPGAHKGETSWALQDRYPDAHDVGVCDRRADALRAG